MHEYYVYELRDMTDPKNPRPIYVGKGIGSRVADHAKVVARKMRENPTDIKSDKEKEIQKILETGDLKAESLGELVIGRYSTEAEAFAVESTLIKWVYGRDILKNIVHGHHADQIRDKGNFDLTNELQPVKFAQQKVVNIKALGIEERADDLKKSLEKLGFNGLECSMFGAQEYGLYWQVPNFPVALQIKFQEANNKVVLNARPSLQHKEYIDINQKAKNFEESKILLKKAGYLLSAEDDREKIFAALFESNGKTGKELHPDDSQKIYNITDRKITIYTSIKNGVEASNVELIGNYMIDLEVRLTIAHQQIDSNNPDNNQNVFLNKLIQLFRSKPAARFFKRRELKKLA